MAYNEVVEQWSQGIPFDRLISPELRLRYSFMRSGDGAQEPVSINGIRIGLTAEGRATLTVPAGVHYESEPLEIGKWYQITTEEPGRLSAIPVDA